MHSSPSPSSHHHPRRAEYLATIKSLLQPLYAQGRISRSEFMRTCKLGLQHALAMQSLTGIEAFLWRELTASVPSHLSLSDGNGESDNKDIDDYEKPTLKKPVSESLAARESLASLVAQLRHNNSSSSSNNNHNVLLEKILKEVSSPTTTTKRAAPSTTTTSTRLARLDTVEFLERQEVLMMESQSRCELMRLYVNITLSVEYTAAYTNRRSLQLTPVSSSPAPTTPRTPRQQQDKLMLLEAQKRRITELYDTVKKKQERLALNHTHHQSHQQQQQQQQKQSLGPSRTDVLEYLQKLLQPLHDSGHMTDERFVVIVDAVCGEFFSSMSLEPASSSASFWQAQLRNLVSKALRQS
eukprot:PhM_4_TR9100/c0_g1_i1/m.83650